MRTLILLGRRAVREGLRQPESTIPIIFIPVFFLFVNLGSLGDAFRGQEWLHGQNYAAFQLPVSMLFAVTGAASPFGLVTDIENGYFDKLLVAPIPRTLILVGRLAADFLRNIVAASLVLLLGFILGVRVDTGIAGVIVLILGVATFGVAYAGFGTLVALKARTAQAVNVTSILFFPLLFLSPNVVPREDMQGWLQVLARYNPVTYVIEGLRVLILEGWDGERLLYAAVATAAVGVFLLSLSLRALKNYNK